MDRSWLSMPRTWRDWMIGATIVIVAGGALFAAFQLRVDRGESECRSKCARTGDDYRYTGPSRREPERCTCVKDR